MGRDRPRDIVVFYFHCYFCLEMLRSLILWDGGSMNLIYMTKLQDNKTDPNTVLVINKLLRLLL
jgi:hypothetical protein